MADINTANTSWSGLQPFIDAIFGNAQGSKGQTTLESIAAGMNRMSPRSHSQQQITPPAGAPPIVGPGAGGGPFTGSVVPGPMAPAAQQIPGMSIKPVSFTQGFLPTPLQGIGSVPQTSSPFTTGAPNPSGSRVA